MSESFVKSFTVFGVLKLTPILWVIACAWPFGGASWSAQQWINLAALPVLVLIIAAMFMSKRRLVFSNSATVLLSLFCGIGFFAIFQSLAIAPQTPLLSSLPSLRLQESYLESPDSISEIRSLDFPSSHVEVGTSISISVDRGHSLAALSNLGLAIIAFAVGYFLIGSSPNLIFATLAIVSINCAILAAIGIAEDIAATKWQLLNIEKPTAFAAFVSRNSAAMFLNVGIACGLGAIGCRLENKSSSNADPQYRYASNSLLSKLSHYLEDIAAEISSSKIAIAAAMVLSFVGILVTLSRGGMASSITAFLVVTGITILRVRKIEGTLLIFSLLAAAATLVIWLDQIEPVTSRIETVTEGDGVNTDLRWTVWKFAQNAFSTFWLTGAGLGNFHYSYLPFQNKPVDTWFYHAESFYWQTAVDIGVVGIAAIIIGISLIVRTLNRLLNQSENKNAQAIAACSIYLFASLAIHSFVDFSLILPGIFIPSCLVFGIAFANAESLPIKRRRRSKRRSRLQRAKDTHSSTESSSRASYLCLVSSFSLVLIGSYYNRPRAIAESIHRELNNWSYDQEEAEASLESIVSRGESALRQFPNDGQLNLEMGEAYTSQYRWLTYRIAPSGRNAWDATHPLVTRAQFFQRSKQESLNIDSLLNDPQRAECLTTALNCWRKAHILLPLDWRPHVALAELDFVDLEKQQTSFHLNKLQTLAFNRPKVLSNAGIVALIYPGPDAAFPIFKRAMESSPNQLNLIFPIALQIYGTRIVTEPFLPQHAPSLLQLVNSYSASNPDPQIVDGIWKQIGAALPFLPDSDRQKPLIAAEAFRRDGNLKGEIDSLRSAVTMNPLNADIRFQYAKALFQDKQYVVAREQINTCIRQQPDKTPFVEFRKLLDESLPNLPGTSN